MLIIGYNILNITINNVDIIKIKLLLIFYIGKKNTTANNDS